MGLPPRQFNPNNPIPNYTFDSPTVYTVDGAFGSTIVGSGLYVDYSNLSINSGSTVTGIIAGLGISVSSSVGNVAISNIGVLSLTAGSGISLSGSTGNITISAIGAGSGTVTNVATGAGLTGGPITTSGTIALAPSGAIAGSYTNANVTVDIYGRITTISNGSAGSGTVTNVATGTGLTGGPISTTGTIALANTAVTPGAYTNANITVDAQGRITSAANGSAGGGGTVTSITAGTGLTGGTITGSGTIALANTAVTPGPYTYASFTVDPQGRITAASSGSTPVIVNDFNAKGNLLVGTANDAFTALGVGTNDYLLTADSTCASGVKWAPNAAMPTTGGIFTGDVTFYGGVQGGAITAIGSFTPGDSYPGNFSWVGSITGGTGSGATGAATSDGSGNITSFTITNGGLGYTVGDTISISAFTPGTPVTAVVGSVTPTIPGAGIVDCAGSLGLPGQVLTATTFNTVQWCAPGGSPATPTTQGVLYGCSTASNVSVGKSALQSLTTGYSNTALGCEGHVSMADGYDNVAVGLGAMVISGSGHQNTAVGTGAMYFTGIGSNNVAAGNQALYSNDVGNENTAIGDLSGYNSTGSANVFLGEQAGFDVAAGDFNTFLGPYSAFGQTGGCCNIAIGSSAVLPNLTGDCQLAIGIGAGNWLTGCSDFAIQPGAGIIDCAGSCGTAGQVLMSDGANAICWGSVSGAGAATPTVAGSVLGCTTATNVGLGCNVFSALTTGVRNVAIGNCALCSITNADENVVLGNCAGMGLTLGSYNVALGHLALCGATTGQFSVVVGCEALSAPAYAGSRNVAIGPLAAATLVTGAVNTFVGAEAGSSLASGNRNSFMGYMSACNATAGSQNVAIGNQVELPNATGSCQLVIGFCTTDYWLTGNSTKAIQPGAGIIDCAGSCGTANQVLVSTGANALQWKSVNSALAVPNYGSFYDTTCQLNTVGTGTGRAITLDTTDPGTTNFSVVGGSCITAACAGTYNLQFSAQFETTTASLQTIEIWLVQNGNPVPYSNTEFTTKGSGESYFAALNYIVPMAAGGNVQLFWASGDANMVLASHGSAYSGPNIPSMIVTIVPVGA